MAVEYPDVMNDVTDARNRYESGAVQYLAWLTESQAAAGTLTTIQLVIQSVMNVSVNVQMRLGMPELKGRLKRMPQPFFRVFQPEISLTLESAEVVQLSIPLYIEGHVPANSYKFQFGVRSAPSEQGQRIRSKHGEDRLGDFAIRSPQGLGLTQLVPWGFQCTEAGAQPLSLQVTEAVAEPTAPEAPELQPNLNSLWSITQWDLIPPARRELNDRRIHIMPELTAKELYMPFMKRSQAVLEACGLRLHVGEAIVLAKMLTYTVLYLASKAEWLDALMVPIYAYAQAGGDSTDDVIWLVTELGYSQVAELSIALAFSLVESALQKQPWPPEEQRALRDFIVECMLTGGQLPTEFLYLPLILGGILVADQVVMDGEDAAQSLALVGKAKEEKRELFADPDLQSISTTFDQFLSAKLG